MDKSTKYYLESLRLIKGNNEKNEIKVEGWAFDFDGITLTIEVQINDISVLRKIIDGRREDVFQHYKSEHSLFSGFILSQELNKVEAADNICIYLLSGKKRIKIYDNKIINLEIEKNEKQKIILYNFDELEYKKNDEILNIRGWCFSIKSNDKVKVEIFSKNKLICGFYADKLRYDVGKVFKEYEYSNQSGFNKSISVKYPIKQIKAKMTDAQNNIVISDLEIKSNKSAIEQDPKTTSIFIAFYKTCIYVTKKAWSILLKKQFRITFSDLKNYYDKAILYKEQQMSRLYVSGLLDIKDPYIVWKKNNELTDDLLDELSVISNRLSYKPRFEIVLLIQNEFNDNLKDTIDSLTKQVYDNFELVLPRNKQFDKNVQKAIKENIYVDYYNDDRNCDVYLEIHNKMISSKCEYIIFMNCGDQLSENTLFDTALSVQNHYLDLIYFDEDIVNIGEPMFKPDWSPELLLSYNYIGNAFALSKKVFAQVEIGEYCYFKSFVYDLLIKLAEQEVLVYHIPTVLYHSRYAELSLEIRNGGYEEGKKILEQAISRRNIVAKLNTPDFAIKTKFDIYSLEFPDEGPDVTIIIPNKNKYMILKKCIESLNKTTYKNYKVKVIDNNSDDLDTINYLSELEKYHSVEKIPNKPGMGFSFSYINNKAALSSDSEYILFLNNDTEVINEKWLSSLMGYLKISGVGITGARLLFPDDRVQHAGIVMGLYNSMAAPAFKLLPNQELGYLCYSKVARNYSAVTAACLLVRKDDFINAGMFDENSFAVAYNDLDFCINMLKSIGKRIVYVPEAELRHYEGATRGYKDNIDEVLNFREKYKVYNDPYYNINLSKENEHFEIITDNTYDYFNILSKAAKLLMVTHNLNFEGAPIQLYEIIKGLVEKIKLHIEVLSPKEGPLREWFENENIPVHVKPFDINSFTNISSYDKKIKELGEWINKNSYNIVYANTLEAFYSLDAANCYNIKTIWSIHESASYRTYFKHLPIEIQSRFIKCFGFVYKVIFVADATRKLYEELDVNKSFTYIHNGLKLDDIYEYKQRISKQKARQLLNISENKKVVLILGTTCERKGQLDLIKAALEVTKNGEKDTIYYVVGGRAGSYLEKIQDFIQENNMNDYIKIVMESKDVNIYYRASDVFVCASYNESYPRVILEAMAFELPIITTLVFGIAEQVFEGVNAISFQPGDIMKLSENLCYILQNEQVREKFSSDSLKVLKLINSYDEMIERYKKIIGNAWVSCYKNKD